jgi:WD40 repeat protein
LTITDAEIRLHEIATGDSHGTPVAYDGPIVYPVLSGDGRRLAGAAGSTVLVWDLALGELATGAIEYAAAVKGLEFHPTDPNALAVLSADQSVRLWDVGPSRRHRVLEEYEGSARIGGWENGVVAFSPTEPLVAAMNDRHREVSIRNTETLALHRPRLQHEGRPDALAFSPNGQTLAVGAGDGMYLWDVHTSTLTVPMQAGGPEGLDFSPDGITLAWSDGPNEVNLWAWQSGETATYVGAGVPVSITHGYGGIQFDHTGERLLLVGSMGKVVLLSASDMQQVGSAMHVDGWTECARLSPDNGLIVTASSSGRAQIWDAHTQRPVGPALRHGAAVRWANFSPDGRYVATASEDMTAQLWDVETQQPVGLPLRHTSAVSCVEFSPDGRTIATAALDARLWELPETPTSLDEVRRKTELATGLRLDEDGRVESLPWREWRALRAEVGATR